MHRSILSVALLLGLAGHTAVAAAHGAHHVPGTSAGLEVQVYPEDASGAAWPAPGFLPGHDHPGPWRLTPWHYHPYGPCPPPWCLPSYHRHRGILVDPDAAPLGTVLARLRRLDYHGFRSAVLNGANYNIIARNRYGRLVRLIVNAGNGQIRRILP